MKDKLKILYSDIKIYISYFMNQSKIEFTNLIKSIFTFPMIFVILVIFSVFFYFKQGGIRIIILSLTVLFLFHYFNFKKGYFKHWYRKKYKERFLK